MHEHDAFAPVELFEDRRKVRIAQPFVAVTRQKGNSVRLKHVKRVFDLAQAAIRIRQWDNGKQTEAVWMALRQFCRILIASPGGMARRVGITKPDARRRQRQDGGSDTVLVHRVECFSRLPTRPRGIDLPCGTGEPFPVFGEIKRRYDMMMDVNESWPWNDGGLRKRSARNNLRGRNSSRRHHPGEKVAPVDAGRDCRFGIATQARVEKALCPMTTQDSLRSLVRLDGTKLAA